MNTNPTAAQPLDLEALEETLNDAASWSGGQTCRRKIESALAMIAQARAAQPESATGTTGASIDTPEFDELLIAYGLSEIAANRFGEDEEFKSNRAALVAHIDAIIGDLRAQLAAKCQEADAWSERWLQAKQLAARGQGKPVAYAFPEGLERLGRVRSGYADSPLLVVHAKEGGGYAVPLYLGAPASAQPDRGAAHALLLEAAFNRAKFSRDVNREDFLAGWNAAHAAAASPASQPVAPEAAPADYARTFLMSQDLYSLLTDVQNGIDSPATCGLANKLIVRLDKVRDMLAAVAPSDTKGKADDLAGRIVSVDVSTGDDDYGNRIFAELTGETGSDGTTLLAIETERNFSDAKGKADAANADVLLDALQKAARLLRAAGFAMNGTATSQIVGAINAATVCTTPPPGWQCTRPAGHDGPCAAIPVTATSAADAKDAARLDFMIAEECQIELFDRPEPDTLYRVRWPYREEHQREWSKTGREAIDAAMAAAPSSEKGGAQ